MTYRHCSKYSGRALPARVKRLTAVLLISLMIFFCLSAFAEYEEITIPDTGEKYASVTDKNGRPVYVYTIEEGTFRAGGDVEAAVLSEYPDAVIFTASDSGAQRTIGIYTPELIGTLVVSGGSVVSRELRGGNISSNGMLTVEGAVYAVEMLVPDAEVVAIELEYEHGLTSYEGDAVVGKAKYEFELDARTGRLIAWESD